MNNKTFKRVVALVASALMLCSCAFAATIGDVTYDIATGKITVNYTAGEGASKAAIMVTKADGTIVAVNQHDGVKTAFNETLDKTKVAVDDVLTIKVGDNAAASTEAASTTFTVVEPVVEYTVTWVVEGETVATETYEAGATPEYKGDAPVKEGYTFTGWTPEIVAVVGDATYTATFEENAPAYEYEVAVQDAKYYTNDPAQLTGVDTSVVNAKIVRITGLNPAEVSVTVDGVTAKYYAQKNSSGEDTGVNVIVAVIPAAGDANDIVITEGTTLAASYGDADGNGSVVAADLTNLGRCVGGVTVTGRGGTTTYYLPTDIEALHTIDVDGDGKVAASDLTLFGRCIGGVTVTGRGGATLYTMDKLTCLTK